jgi:glycine cleavage system transcriptional repressor
MAGFLVISALGEDKPGIIEQLTRQVAFHECNIHDSRMTVLGGEFAIILLVSGAEPSLQRLAPVIEEVAERLGLKTLLRRTSARPSEMQSRPYQVQVVALDHPGIVHEIARFFSERDLNIEEMDTQTYAAPHTGSPMFSLNMVVNIGSATTVRALRDDFMDFCDVRNLDATLEPAKGS